MLEKFDERVKCLEKAFAQWDEMYSKLKPKKIS